MNCKDGKLHMIAQKANENQNIEPVWPEHWYVAGGAYIITLNITKFLIFRLIGNFFASTS
jgi:hypothetical protein